MPDRKCWSIVKTHCNSRQEERKIEIIAASPPRYPSNSVSGPTRGRFYSLQHAQTACDSDMKKSGNVWYLPKEEENVICGTLTLFANKFRFTSRDRETYVEETFMPHSFIRPCGLQMRANTIDDPFCFVFLIGSHSLPDSDWHPSRPKSYYFAVSGTNKEKVLEDRAGWLDTLSHMLQQVTLSMFPKKSAISTSSGSNVHTENLIMAGHLLMQLDSNTVRVVYAVLHPQYHTLIRLQLYNDADCTMPFVRELSILPKTCCYEKMGHDHCGFVVDNVHLVARTTFERRAWMRAICNLKVKVQFRAPSPDRSELRAWRASIDAYLAHAPDTRCVDPVCAMSASAFPVCGPPHISPLQGDCPIDDDIDDSVSDASACSVSGS